MKTQFPLAINGSLEIHIFVTASSTTHAQPGGNVLILGGGAGGDAEGALLAGCNVFVVEKDPAQF
jgi:hypothetical protein